MQQTPEKPTGPARNQSHLNKRPPRLVAGSAPEQTPHQHVEQRPDEGEVTTYRIAEGQYIDPLDLPDSVKRPGYAYRWVAKSVLGSEDARVRRMYTIALQAGWREVPGDRAKGYISSITGKDMAIIDNGGLVLMERPMHIENESRRLNAKAASDQLNNKLQEIGMQSPANVRSKLISHKIDERPDIIQQPSQAEVPE